MRILLVTPHPLKSPRGNTQTATRWRCLLERMRHEITVAERYPENDREHDLLIALHALKSGAAVRRFKKRNGARVILALTGTDLYPDIYRNRTTEKTLDAADRLIVLQPYALTGLKPRHREKARVVYQCATPNAPRAARSSSREEFAVCVVGHLRPVKDPFRTAMAVRGLPATSRIQVAHFGEALSESMAARARAEQGRNPRYRWFGLLPAAEVRRRMARSDLLVVSSKHEGGANVISEGVASDLPIIASEVDGNVGLLGPDYPGYFEAGNTRALTSLLCRAESERPFRDRLRKHCRELRPLLADPENERKLLANVVSEVE